MNAIASTNPTTTLGTILALDLGKYKSVACRKTGGQEKGANDLDSSTAS
jgi:hypothetical protein